MKKCLLLLFPVFLGVLAAREPSPQANVTDYHVRANWVRCDMENKAAAFDVFYVYPVLFADKNRPLMEWKNDSKLRDKTAGFVNAQTGIFGPGVRVFAPYVRQLEYGRCIGLIGPGGDWRKSPALFPGVADTAAAFRYYLEHFNGGRPYILFGHSQGSIDLYRMMLLVPDVAVSQGFVAAYLIGLPRLTRREIAADFARRGISPASDASGTGVIVGWNTQAPGAENPRFTGKETFCINPLNWRTDGKPAGKAENAGAFFYDYRTKKGKAILNFCGARIDPVRGALLVDLPVNGKYDAKGFMGKGVFHMNDVWFFAGNLRDNAFLRVKAWREARKGK